MVFLAQDLEKNKRVVLKMLKPIRKSKFEREVIILNILKGNENILNYLEVIKNPIKLMYTIVT